MKLAISVILLAATVFAQSGSPSTSGNTDSKNVNNPERTEARNYDYPMAPCSGVERMADSANQRVSTPVHEEALQDISNTKGDVSTSTEVKRDGEIHLVFPKGTPGVLTDDCEIDKDGKPIRGCKFKIKIPTAVTRK
jgi:hypothetical protein